MFAAVALIPWVPLLREIRRLERQLQETRWQLQGAREQLAICERQLSDARVCEWTNLKRP